MKVAPFSLIPHTVLGFQPRTTTPIVSDYHPPQPKEATLAAASICQLNSSWDVA